MQPPHEQLLRPSLFDILTDPDSVEAAARPDESLTRYTESVRRDVELLFNTRGPSPALYEGFPEAFSSVLAFGLTDMSTYDRLGPEDCKRLADAVVKLVNRFEPRLCKVRARVVGKVEPKDRTLKIQIDAGLNIDPSPAVAFRTTIELTEGGQHKVERER